MLQVISIEEAEQQILSVIYPLQDCEQVSLVHALDRVLASDIRALEDIPSGDRSMVDGYAVMAADTNGASEAIPSMLACVGEVPMGRMPELTLCSGQCCRIWTGGFLPGGADAAVMLEDTEQLGNRTVCVSRPAAPGNHLVYRGDEMKTGQLLIEKGTVLGPAELGTLASMGQAEVSVFRRTVVGLLSTGDELVEVGEAPKPGQMRDVNRTVLRACIEKAGGTVLDLGICGDSRDKLQETLAQAAEHCDLIVTSGGTSAGARDFLPGLLAELGTVLWHGLAVKPGKPTLGAVIGTTPVLGLPGHPAAACMIWQLLGLPALARLQGRKKPTREAQLAILAEPVSANDGRAQLLPVQLKDGRALPIRSKSGIISQLLRADGFLVIDRNREGIPAGAQVEVQKFHRKNV